MAGAKGKDQVAWFFICALTGIIGIIILAFQPPDTASSPMQRAVLRSGEREARKRWAALVELDPDIAAAAEKARSYGPACEELLADKYLTLNDKAYLAAALAKAISASQVRTEAMRVKVDKRDDDSGEISGPLGLSRYSRTQEWFVIVEGPFTGNSFRTHDEMVQFFSP